MSVFLPKGCVTYRYEFAANGVLYRGSTGIKRPNIAAAQKFEAILKTETLADAARAARQVEAKRTLGIVDSNGRTLIPTFLKAADEYWQNVGHKAVNAKEDEKNLIWLTDVIGCDTLVTDIRNRTVEMVVTKRAAMPKLSRSRHNRQTGEMIPGRPQVIDFETQESRDFIEGKDDLKHILRSTASTVNRTSIDLLKRVILYARDTLEVPGMPAIRWKEYRLKEPPPRSRTLSYAEEQRLEEHLREGYGAAFKFAVKAGFRLDNFAGEFVWDQVNFESRRITVVQKGGEVFAAIMTDEVEAILRAQVGRDVRHVFMFHFKGRGADPKPWVNPRNGKRYVPGELYPVTYWGFDSWFDDIKKATGLDDVTIHDLRRTAASRVMRATGNLEAARRLTGHKSNAMLLTVYNKLSEEEAFEDLNEAERRIAERRKQELAKRAAPQSSPQNVDERLTSN
jgi:integrase